MSTTPPQPTTPGPAALLAAPCPPTGSETGLGQPDDRRLHACLEDVRNAETGLREAYGTAWPGLYRDLVRFLLPRVRGDRLTAETLAGETLARGWEKLRTWRGGNLRGWLFQIARNLWHDFNRERAARPEELSPLQPAPSADEGPAAEAAQQQVAALLRFADCLRTFRTDLDAVSAVLGPWRGGRGRPSRKDRLSLAVKNLLEQSALALECLAATQTVPDPKE